MIYTTNEAQDKLMVSINELRSIPLDEIISNIDMAYNSHNTDPDSHGELGEHSIIQRLSHLSDFESHIEGTELYSQLEIHLARKRLDLEALSYSQLRVDGIDLHNPVVRQMLKILENERDYEWDYRIYVISRLQLNTNYTNQNVIDLVKDHVDSIHKVESTFPHAQAYLQHKIHKALSTYPFYNGIVKAIKEHDETDLKAYFDSLLPNEYEFISMDEHIEKVNNAIYAIERYIDYFEIFISLREEIDAERIIETYKSHYTAEIRNKYLEYEENMIDSLKEQSNSLDLPF